MANMFRPSSSVNKPPPAATSLRIQQSVQGKGRTIGWGQTRIAGNLIWYGDFTATAVNTGGGGKGGGGGGGGKGGSGNTSYQYSAAVAISMCEGPVSDVFSIWYNKQKTTYQIAQNPFSEIWQASGQSLNLTLFNGAYTQTAWGYLSSLHASEALNYRGDAYMAAGPLQLGDSPELPNFTFEVRFSIFGAYTGTTDANPRDALLDALTNDKYGLGFPASRWEGSNSWSNYCVATGLVMSPVVTDQKTFADHMRDWLAATNSEAVWSAGKLKIVPYGDQTITAHGATYTVPTSPLYAVTDADLMPGSSQTGAPILVHRARVEDRNNSVSVEYLDATNDYNPAVVEVKDDAAIQVYGLKKKTLTEFHQITQKAAATMSASLMLGREQVLNTYEFSVQGCFILLEPMDIITVTDAALSSAAIAVRIKEITENEDLTLTIQAEDYLAGAGSSPLYGSQPGQGALPDYNADPGVVAAPVIFEPTDELAHGLFIWGAVTGIDLTDWGGCEVWASWDGITYSKVEENLVGGARMGVLTAQLAFFNAPVQGPSLDNTNTLSVDLVLSHGQLASGSAADNLLFGSMLWVDGELISYQTAAVTGTYSYNLTGLNRGALGTDITAHLAGSFVTRVDQGIFSVPYTQDKIGATLSLKFLSFNKYGANKQGLADVGAYTYSIVGTALTSPLPDVVNFVSSYVGNITYLDWDIVDDFRSPILYEVRKGASWDSGQFVGTFAHPHVPAIGDDDYWIKAVCTPTAGLVVYSENPILISIAGSVVPLNLLASYDEAPSGTNWPGTLSGDVINDGTFIHTLFSDPVGTGTDYLAVANVFAVPNKYLYGSGQGYYTIPDTHIIDGGRLSPCLVQIIFQGVGIGSTDFFHPGSPDDNDFFAHADVFDSAANRYVDVHPEISISTDGVTFGPWQRYQAGVYNLWKIKARMFIQSLDPINVEAALVSFEFIVYAPTRVDHPLVNVSLAPAGQAVVFAPDGGAAAPFKGGPNGGTTSPATGIVLPNPAALPGIQVVNLSLQQGDDIFITGLSLSGCTIQAKNAGVGVARNVTVQVWGF